MLFTEQEAITKWCPFLQVAVSKPMSETPEFVTNRDHRIEASSNCAGSGCMAWRWGRRGGVRATEDDPPRGFCGAFGVPQGVFLTDA